MRNDRKGMLKEFHSQPEAFVGFLLEKGLLAGDIRQVLEEDILAHPERSYAKAYHWIPFMPKLVSLVATAGCCNLACRMCGGSKGKLQFVSAAQLERILDNIPTAELLIFVAGNSEPLMNPEFPGLLDVLARRQINYSLVSNGHFLNGSIAKALAGFPHHSDINISLDAASDETYKRIRGISHAKVLENLAAFAKLKAGVPKERLSFSLLMVGMADNIQELPDFVALAARFGAGRVKVDHMEGLSEPGDFMRNPDWQCHLRRGLAAANSLGVILQLPADAKSVLSRNASAAASGDPAPAAPCVTSCAEASKAGAQKLRCGWLHSLHIEMGGSIHPCCHTTSETLGNIYDAPLQRNTAYLSARRLNSEGLVFRPCAKVLNCAYVQSLRSEGSLSSGSKLFID